jgi:hypothetical protein
MISSVVLEREERDNATAGLKLALFTHLLRMITRWPSAQELVIYKHQCASCVSTVSGRSLKVLHADFQIRVVSALCQLLLLENKIMGTISVWDSVPNICSLTLQYQPGSSVSIGLVFGYGLDDRVVEVRSPGRGETIFLYLLYPDRLWAHPARTRGSFPRS